MGSTAIGVTGGITLTTQAAIQLASMVSVAITSGVPSSQAGSSIAATPGPYRPPLWAKNDSTGALARYSISYQTGNLPFASTSSTPATYTGATKNGTEVLSTSVSATLATQILVFDAVIRATHSRELKITDYPVQTGQNFSYNAVLQPQRLVMEIGMSDAMDMYLPGMWDGAATKSVSAYLMMLNLQQYAVPLTINSIWGSYSPMLLESISLPDDNTTFRSAKMTLTFRQIFVSALAPAGQSARTQTTDSTQTGTVSSTPVPTSVENSNNIDNDPTADSAAISSTVAPINPGNFTSNSGQYTTVSGLNA